MPPAKTRSRAFRILHNPKKAKTHWIYSERDVRGLYQVSRNTVPKWISTGLQPISGLSQRLFTGQELNRFHAQRRLDASRKPTGSELLCLACRRQQAMAGRTVLFSSLSGISGRLKWTCPECDRDAIIRFGPEGIRRLEAHGVHIQRTSEAIE